MVEQSVTSDILLFVDRIFWRCIFFFFFFFANRAYILQPYAIFAFPEILQKIKNFEGQQIYIPKDTFDRLDPEYQMIIQMMTSETSATSIFNGSTEELAKRLKKENPALEVFYVGRRDLSLEKIGLKFISVKKFREGFESTEEEVPDDEKEEKPTYQLAEVILGLRSKEHSQVLSIVIAIASAIFTVFPELQINVNFLYPEQLENVKTSVDGTATWIGTNLPLILLVLGLGIVGFWFRKNNRLLYGLIEVICGVLLTRFAINLERMDASEVLKALASIYVVIRGLDNVEQGLLKKHREKWDYYFSTAFSKNTMKFFFEEVRQRVIQ